jgi:GxxExxY protein
MYNSQSASIDELTELVIKCAFHVHQTLGQGFLESVYRNSLILELHKAGLIATMEAELEVLYEGEIVGKFFADIVVEGRLIIELKAVSKLILNHELQLVNYLKATGIDNGLLINFGSPRAEVKRKFRMNKSILI